MKLTLLTILLILSVLIAIDLTQRRDDASNNALQTINSLSKHCGSNGWEINFATGTSTGGEFVCHSNKTPDEGEKWQSILVDVTHGFQSYSFWDSSCSILNIRPSIDFRHKEFIRLSCSQ